MYNPVFFCVEHTEDQPVYFNFTFELSPSISYRKPFQIIKGLSKGKDYFLVIEAWSKRSLK